MHRTLLIDAHLEEGIKVGSEPLHSRFKGIGQTPYLPDSSLKKGTLSDEGCNAIWRIIWQGSWTEVIDMDKNERHWFYGEPLHSYIERDIRLNAREAKLEAFEKFLGILASHIGQEFQISRVASQTGIAIQTTKGWLSGAERLGLIYLLPPFYKNVGKVLIKKPKLFSDTGFPAWLMDTPFPEALKTSYLSDAFFESFVLIERHKSYLHNGKHAGFYFYSDSKFNEIDLLIKEGARCHPVEIKTTEHPNPTMIKAFERVRDGSFTRGPDALICLTQTPTFLTSDVVAHSIWDS